MNAIPNWAREASQRVTQAISIPEEVLIPIVTSHQKQYGKCVDNFTTYEVESIKRDCGPEWAHIPTDDIRRQSINLRKRGELGRINDSSHGPAKYVVSAKMEAYYQTEHWKAFRTVVIEFYRGRCALCYSTRASDVHHRTYQRLGCELLSDCVLLCRNCHKLADRRRQREAAEPQDTLGFDDESSR